MALSYATRRRLSLLILLVGMPLYIVAAVTVVSLFDRPPFWLEIVIYIALGFLWIMPFRAVFRGIGQADPNATKKGPDPKI
jgi:predicted membrane channel-forming protein YqfA (hemolysin III family)